MPKYRYPLTGALCVLFLVSLPVPAPGADPEEHAAISEITVSARRIANESPAGTYASAVTNLRYDPLTELQSRGIAEGQSDVTVRGGVFENTGFKIGAVTVTDPQTGHYVAELPVDPALMSTPAVLHGVNSAIEGFNAAIATVAFGISEVAAGGRVMAGAGNDSLNFQALRSSYVTKRGVGLALSAARSAGDGTLPFGDHDFVRLNAVLQFVEDQRQTDLIVAYQDKFFGWPGAYTGFASLPETDDTQTSLVLVNQRRVRRNGWLEYGAYFRRLVDDYDFNRTDSESGTPGSFDHETEIMAAGFQGSLQAGRVEWRFGGQLSQDELVRSTDLVFGSFTDRSYAKLTIVPSVATRLVTGSLVTWRFGLTADYSNRDESEVLPLAGLSLETQDAAGSTTWSLEYAATSQLPGYTALNSNPVGLFGGNALLGRELARQLSASVTREADQWQARVALFARSDEDLVDWTYAVDAPFARQANAVDLDVLGFEAFMTRAWSDVDVAAGFTWLDKDADYGRAAVDASYYALNFARLRATLALRYRFADRFELRFDSEYRRQEENPLRVGDETAFLASAALEWNRASREGVQLALVIDNLTDSEYQPFPGTPASGRQYSLSVGYAW